jgi:hypothetical protein
MDMETWRHEDMDLRHGTWTCGDMDTWRHGHGDEDMELKIGEF